MLRRVQTCCLKDRFEDAIWTFKVFGKLFLKDQRAAGCLVGSNKLVARNRYAVTCRILLCGTGACAYCLVTANNVESAKLGRKMRWVQRFVYVMI